MGTVLAAGSAARLARPVRADQEGRHGAGGRPAAADGQPAIRQVPARTASARRPRALSMAAQLEPILGRYMTLALDGRPHRIYFEEAREGIPLLCLHTAGADGWQFRHLMLDEDITRHYRVLAFDMPWHGSKAVHRALYGSMQPLK